MKTTWWAIALLVVCTVFTAAAQLFWKQGSNDMGSDVSRAGMMILIGFVLYGIAAVLMIIALKYGELSVLYPIIALSFIWVNILGWQMLGESLSTGKWMGIALVIVGVSCIGRGS